MSISLTNISLFLIGPPQSLKHISIDFISPELIFVGSNNTTINLGIFID